MAVDYFVNRFCACVYTVNKIFME